MRFPVLILALLMEFASAQAQTVAEIEQAWRGRMSRNGRTTGVSPWLTRAESPTRR